MAIITSTIQLNMSTFGFGTVTEAADYTNQQTFSSTFQKLSDVTGEYTMEANGTFTAPDAGTVTSYREYVTNEPSLYFSMTGINSTIAQLDLGLNDQLSGADNITGSVHADVIRGFAGADTIDGGAGNDTIYGGAAQADTGDSHDRISGGLGRDLIFGNSGNDIIYGDLSGSADGDVDNIFGGLGNDTIYGGAGADYLAGGGGVAHPADEADTIYGGAGDDFILGNGDNDLLYGGDDATGTGSGNDRIFGGLGNDTIYGGDGNDTLVGQNGNDVLYGGDGADRFVFLRGGQDDTIQGFQDGSDHLYISNSLQNGVNSYATLMAASQIFNGGLLIMLDETGIGDDGDLSIYLAGVTTLSQGSVVFGDPDAPANDFITNMPNFLGTF